MYIHTGKKSSVFHNKCDIFKRESKQYTHISVTEQNVHTEQTQSKFAHAVAVVSLKISHIIRIYVSCQTTKRDRRHKRKNIVSKMYIVGPAFCKIRIQHSPRGALLIRYYKNLNQKLRMAFFLLSNIHYNAEEKYVVKLFGERKKKERGRERRTHEIVRADVHFNRVRRGMDDFYERCNQTLTIARNARYVPRTWIIPRVVYSIDRSIIRDHRAAPLRCPS